MKTKTYAEMTVKRDGDQIVLPAAMSYGHARDWLTKIEVAEETVIDIHVHIECFPLDGLCALNDFLVERFSWVDLPTCQIQIPDGPHSTRTAAYGTVKPPMLDGGWIEVLQLGLDHMDLHARCRRKFEADVHSLFNAIKERLRTASIYRGKAIRVRFPDDMDWSANPQNTAPAFMDLNGISGADLILNAPVQFALDANVFCLIEQTEACRKARIPLRHGMLLAGPYGTGKTLTAKVIAAKCVANGWTFVYLEDVRQIAHGLRVAEMFAPAVLFAEDIDSVVGSNRDGNMNDILNVLDGIDTKSKAIVSVLTTNRLDAIHRSFLRAGRIDTVVEFDSPDAATAFCFVQLYCRDKRGDSLLAADVEAGPTGEAFAGLLPAFIAEAIQKSKRYSLLVGDKLVSQDTLLKAAAAIRRHAALVAEPPTLTLERRLLEAVALVGDAGHSTMLDDTRGNVGAFKALLQS